MRTALTHDIEAYFSNKNYKITNFQVFKLCVHLGENMFSKLNLSPVCQKNP
jgi:hypothetical protein